MGTFGFRFPENGFGLEAFHIKTLDGPADRDDPALEINIFPFQGTDLAQAKARVKAEKHGNLKKVLPAGQDRKQLFLFFS